MTLPSHETLQTASRRRFLLSSAGGLGLAALAHLLRSEQAVAADAPRPAGALNVLHVPPRAERIIYLLMSGGPSQIDLFDPKPQLRRYHGLELPDSVRRGQRLTTMTSGQGTFPCVQSPFRFARHGQSGTWLSELMPHMGRVIDNVTVLRAVHTEAINHDPAITLLMTGFQQPGQPSFGSWLSYGLGSANQDLPAFVMLLSNGSGNPTDQPVSTRLWGSGFLPSQHQGVRFRSGQDPVLYLSNPPGLSAADRRRMLDSVNRLNQLQHEAVGDPEIQTRIAQYEMAFRMQSSVPDLTDLSREPAAVRARYGLDRPGNDGGYARNCLLARRLAERGVRFVQLIHRGWDQHSSLIAYLRAQCQDVDQPTAALLEDLKQRGLLDTTLVVWGGEFGRTVYGQDPATEQWGRDHHGRCFSLWLAGGGIRPGITYGATDDFCYNVTENPVHIHDLNATLLHCLGIDHTRLTFRFQGRDFRLTNVGGDVVRDLLA
jgi:hypothetical protein